MNYTNSFLYALGLLWAGASLGAGAQAQQRQTLYGGRIAVEYTEPARHRGDSLTISFRLTADSLALESERSLTLTPLLEGADTLRLQPLLLNGRNRHQVYRRNLSLGAETPGAYYDVLKMTGRTEKSIDYRQTFFFEPWMETARLALEADLCGCGGHTEEITREVLFPLSLPRPVPAGAAKAAFEPAYCYVQPAPETLKNRTELKNIYLNFPVNQVVIQPGYMNNPAELGAAREMVERLKADKNLAVREVVIRGYASPEGSVAANRRLSEGRADALKKYLSARWPSASIPFRSEGAGEDWDGVIEALATASFPGADVLADALRICDRSDAAEQALRKLNGGQPYGQMAQTIYPKVRRVTCSVAYTARAFTLEESRELIGRHPEQLSLEEIWQVAASYPENSEPFKAALRTAVQVFPDDETALVNAAHAALADGQTDEAARYLERVMQGSRRPGAAAENALGLLAVARNNYAVAIRHFQRAVAAGSEAEQKIDAQAPSQADGKSGLESQRQAPSETRRNTAGETSRKTPSEAARRNLSQVENNDVHTQNND